MTERQAIMQMKQGDIIGLETLVNMYYTQAVRAAYLVTHDKGTAEDIVQSAFLRAYERINQFDIERPFGPWFLKIIVNDSIKAATRQKRFFPLDVSKKEQYSVEENPEALAEFGATKEAIQAALLKIPPDQRAVVVMRYFLDMNTEEIAQEMDSLPATTRWRLHAGLKRLRLLLRSRV